MVNWGWPVCLSLFILFLTKFLPLILWYTFEAAQVFPWWIRVYFKMGRKRSAPEGSRCCVTALGQCCTEHRHCACSLPRLPSDRNSHPANFKTRPGRPQYLGQRGARSGRSTLCDLLAPKSPSG